MMKRLFIVLSVLISVNLLHAQESPLRVEINLENYMDEIYAMPVGKEGVIIFYEGENSRSDNKLWYFVKYDTKFEEIWTKEVLIDKTMDYNGYRVNIEENKLYLLFNYVTGYLKKGKECTVLEFDYVNGDNKQFTAVSPMTIDIRVFSFNGDMLYMGGRTVNNFAQSCVESYCGGWWSLFTGKSFFPPKAAMVMMDMKTERMQMQPYTMKGSSEIISIDKYKSSITNVVVNHVYKTPKTFVEQYDQNGDLVNTIDIPAKSAGKQLLTAQLTPLSDDETVIIGVFNKYSKQAYLNATANGFYFGKLTGDKLKYINYYNFSDLKNFYKYMSAKQQKKTKKKVAKAKSKGKELDINYNLLVHDVIIRGDQYIMIGEAYYAEYETRCHTTYVNGQSQTTCYQVFVGWRYTHSLIAAFDKEGELLWDNAFEIYNVLTFDLSEKIKVMFDDEDVILVYNFGGYINSKIIRGDKVLEGKTKTKIETNYDSDKVKGNFGSSMDFWYDNYFIAYGTQLIKDTAKGKNRVSDKKKRTVFYFNKIAFE